jgi:hypothetical protein
MIQAHDKFVRIGGDDGDIRNGDIVTALEPMDNGDWAVMENELRW